MAGGELNLNKGIKVLENPKGLRTQAHTLIVMIRKVSQDGNLMIKLKKAR